MTSASKKRPVRIPHLNWNGLSYHFGILTPNFEQVMLIR
jgi:hypothetical protein